MKARITVEHKEGTEYSNYENVSGYDISSMKKEIINQLKTNEPFVLKDIYEGGKNIVIIPSEIFKNSIITIECQEA